MESRVINLTPGANADIPGRSAEWRPPSLFPSQEPRYMCLMTIPNRYLRYVNITTP